VTTSSSCRSGTADGPTATAATARRKIEAWAREHELPFFDGSVHFPDARIEYEDQDRHVRLEDIEVVTEHYRGAHAAGMARSGFTRQSGSPFEQRRPRRRRRPPNPRSAEELGDAMSDVAGFMTRAGTRRQPPTSGSPGARPLPVTVMLHSGVIVRPLRRFAGITHGQKTHDFIDRLVGRGFAHEVRPGALHRGRLYQVHHKRLYALIGQTYNRNRRRAPLSRMIERLMLLDAVLDDGEFMWLATEADKSRYFLQRLAEYRFERRELPHLTFGSGATKTLRLFPDKFPIGVDPIADRHVFTYLITRPAPVDFRAFLLRHFTMLKPLHTWTLRLLVPKRFEKAIPVYRHAVREELATPLHPSDADELRWLFEQRKRASAEPSFVPDRRFVEATKQFSAPRFRVLYRLCSYTETTCSGTPTRRCWRTSSTETWPRSSASSSRVHTCISTHLVGASPERRSPPPGARSSPTCRQRVHPPATLAQAALVPVLLPWLLPEDGARRGTSQNFEVVPLAIEVSGSTSAGIRTASCTRSAANMLKCGNLRDRSPSDRTAP
jgi:hypothetical protein